MIYVGKRCGAAVTGSRKHDPPGPIQHHAKSATCAKSIRTEHLGGLRERGVRHKKGSATGSFHKGAVTNSYAYDGMMRLVAESGPGGGTAYAYDLCGNRLSVTAQGGTTSNTYTHNRRDADTHDAAGNVTRTVNARGQTLDLSWNLQRQLVSVSTNGVFAESYAYDPLGRRVSTTDISGTVYHAYDGIHCVADLDGDGSILRAYTWGAGVDNLLAVTLIDGAATNTLYAVTDPLGTVHALVDASGTVTVSYTYDSWGNLLSASGSDSLIASLRFTWQGREYSRATGLYNFRARWYDPAAGRWLSKDPIGLEGGLNLYEAFGNNPVCFRDPEGQLTWRQVGLFVGELAIGAGVTAAVIFAAPLAVTAGVATLTALGVSATTAATISAGTVSAGLFVMSVGGICCTAYSVMQDIENCNWDYLAFTLGSVTGGMLVGSLGGGRYMVESMMGHPSPAPNTWNLVLLIQYEFANRYQPSMGPPNLEYFATSPTPMSGGSAAITITTGIESLVR